MVIELHGIFMDFMANDIKLQYINIHKGSLQQVSSMSVWHNKAVFYYLLPWQLTLYLSVSDLYYDDKLSSAVFPVPEPIVKTLT